MDAADMRYPQLSDEDVSHEKMVAFVARVSQFRPHGLFGKVEDDIAGLRQDAEKLIREMPRPSTPATEGHVCATPTTAWWLSMQSRHSGAGWICSTCGKRWDVRWVVTSEQAPPAGKAKATAPLTPGEKATIDAMRADVEHVLAQEMGPKLAAAAVGRTSAGQTCVERCAHYPNCPHPSAATPETPTRVADVARVEIAVDPRLPSASGTIRSPKDYVSMADVLKDFSADSDEAKIAERFFGFGAELVTIYKTPDGSPVVETREFCELGHHGLVDPACVSCARVRPRRRPRPAGCVCPPDGSGTCEAHLPKDPLDREVTTSNVAEVRAALDAKHEEARMVDQRESALVESLREVHRNERESWEAHRDRLSEEVKILRAFAERCMAPENDGLPGIQEAAQDAISEADAARSAATPPSEDERVVPRRDEPPRQTAYEVEWHKKYPRATMRQPEPNPCVEAAMAALKATVTSTPDGAWCGSVSPLGGDICCRRTHAATSACVAKNGSLWNLADASARSLPVAPPVSAPDPRGGPFPPSTRGTVQPDGSRTWSTGTFTDASGALWEPNPDGSMSRETTAEELRAAQRRLFEKAFRAGQSATEKYFDRRVGDGVDEMLAAALKEEGFS